RFCYRFNELLQSEGHSFLQSLNSFFIFRGPSSFESYFLCYTSTSACYLHETPIEFHCNSWRRNYDRGPAPLFDFRQFPLVGINASLFCPAPRPRNEWAFQLCPFDR